MYHLCVHPAGCGPPVGAYDPKALQKIPGVVVTKEDRFKVPKGKMFQVETVYRGRLYLHCQYLNNAILTVQVIPMDKPTSSSGIKVVVMYNILNFSLHSENYIVIQFEEIT